MKGQQTTQERKVTLSLGTGQDGQMDMKLTIRKIDEYSVSICVNDESASGLSDEETGLDIITSDHLMDNALMQTEKILKDLLHGPKVGQTSEIQLLEALRQNTHWKIFREEGNGQEAWESLRDSFERKLGAASSVQQPSPCGILHITGGRDLTLGNVNHFSQWVQESLGWDASIFVGCTVDESWNEKIEVSMLLAEGNENKGA